MSPFSELPKFASSASVLEQLPCGIAILNAAGKMIYANPVAARWLAASPADSLANALGIWCRTSPPRQPVRVGESDLQVQLAPLDASGKSAGWIAVLHDVTRMAEHGRRHARFISDAVHELRNPITALKLSASVMDRIPREEWPDQVQSFLWHTDYLSRVIEDVLEVSRLESGHVELEWHQIFLDAFLSDFVAGQQPQAESRGVSLHLALEYPVPPILGDPKRVRQILSHVLSNAIRFTPSDGDIHVRVFKIHRDERPWVGVRVADTGLGIEAQALEHIFEPFYRAASARRSGSLGAGLGLAIVRGLVDLHGGSISVESTPGSGTVFTLSFPAAP